MSTLVDGIPDGTDVGDTITYAVSVANSGESTLTKLKLEIDTTTDISCIATELGAGDSTTCTATYGLDQAAVDLGVVTQTVTVSGQEQISGETIDASETTTYEFPPGLADLTVGSGAEPIDIDADGFISVGDEINYSFGVKNTGASTLLDVAVTDATLGTVVCTPDMLSPGETVICTTAYEIQPEDAIAGEVYVEGTAQAATRLGVSVEATAPGVTQQVEILPPPGVDASVRLDVDDVRGQLHLVSLTATTQEPATQLRLRASSDKPVLRATLPSFGGWECDVTRTYRSLDCTIESSSPAPITFIGQILPNTTLTVDLETVDNDDPDLSNNRDEFFFRPVGLP